MKSKDNSSFAILGIFLLVVVLAIVFYIAAKSGDTLSGPGPAGLEGLQKLKDLQSDLKASESPE